MKKAEPLHFNKTQQTNHLMEGKLFIYLFHLFIIYSFDKK